MIRKGAGPARGFIRGAIEFALRNGIAVPRAYITLARLPRRILSTKEAGAICVFSLYDQPTLFRWRPDTNLTVSLHRSLTCACL